MKTMLSKKLGMGVMLALSASALSMVGAVAGGMKDDVVATNARLDEFTSRILAEASDVQLHLKDYDAGYPECRAVLGDLSSRIDAAKAGFQADLDGIQQKIEQVLSEQESRRVAARDAYEKHPTHALREAYKLQRYRYRDAIAGLKVDVETDYEEAYKRLVLAGGFLNLPTYVALEGPDNAMVRNIFGEQLGNATYVALGMHEAIVAYRPVFANVKTSACTYIVGDEIVNWFKMARRQDATVSVAGGITLKKPHMLHTDLRRTVRFISDMEAWEHNTFDFQNASREKSDDAPAEPSNP